MRFYLSAPMTGMPGSNREHMTHLANQLRSVGHDVSNPAEMDGEETEGWEWEDFLARDIPILLQGEFDGIVLDVQWHQSRGCNCEAYIATVAGIEHFTFKRAMVTEP